MLARVGALRALAGHARARARDRLIWAPLRRSSFDARASGEQASAVFEVLREDGSGAGNAGGSPPTEKQLRFAQLLAQERGIPVPGSAMQSKQACSTFIEESQALTGGGPAEIQLPTEKQLNYARRLADEFRIELPAEALSSRRACSEFIDSVPPSPRQVQFARTIAERHGLELPPQVLSNKRACSEFLDGYQQQSLTSNAVANRPPWAAAGPQRRPPYSARTERAPPHGAVDSSGLLDSETLAVLHKLAAATNPSRPSLYHLLTGVLVAQEHALGLPQEALQSFRRVLPCVHSGFYGRNRRDRATRATAHASEGIGLLGLLRIRLAHASCPCALSCGLPTAPRVTVVSLVLVFLCSRRTPAVTARPLCPKNSCE